MSSNINYDFLIELKLLRSAEIILHMFGKF